MTRKRTARYRSFAGLSCLCVFTCACAAQRAVVVEGDPRAVIVYPGADAAGRRAAREAAALLGGYLAEMTGQTIPVVGEERLAGAAGAGGTIAVGEKRPADLPARIDTFILVGEGRLAKELNITAGDLTAGGVRIKTAGNAIVLAGSPAASDPDSTRHAVYTFLETLGCRLLWPGRTGRIVPKLQTLRVGPLDLAYQPPVKQRHLRFSGIRDRAMTGLARLGIAVEDYRRWKHAALAAGAHGRRPAYEWRRWQRLGGSIGIRGGHAFGHLWETCGKDHPEWFALQADGTRDQSGTGSRERLCVSNPALCRYIADTILAAAAQDPEKKCFSVCPNDGGYASYCLCPACKKLDPPGAEKIPLKIFEKAGEPRRREIRYPSLTDRYVHFWNAIAERVAETRPDLLLLGQAYSTHRLPPVRETLHPAVAIRYVPSTADGWRGWAAAGATKMYWRPNILLREKRTGRLCVYGESMTATFHFIADNGMLATDFDSVAHFWATHGLNYYVAARLNWNPALAFEEIIDDYCRTGFGPAAGAVRRYFLLAQEATDPTGRENRDAQTRPYLDDHTLRGLRKLLNAAADRAGGDRAITGRIAFLRIGLNVTELQVRIDALAAQATNKQPWDRDAAQRLMTINFYLLRDIARHHTLAINTPMLMWGSGNYARWRVLGWRALHEKLLAKTAGGADLADAFTVTGEEDSIDAVAAALGLDEQD